MAIDNDTRGWIMTAISGIACVVGASIICIDIPVRLFPGMQKFSITESDAFLSASLSLSFGVMLFSAMYSMLPQSRQYLQNDGYSPQAAAWIQIALFLAGVVGIRILSSVIHHFIPSHIVDCDHKHDEEAAAKSDENDHNHDHEERHQNGTAKGGNNDAEEDTPLLRVQDATPPNHRTSTAPDGSISKASQAKSFVTAPSSRRPSLFPRALTKTFSKYVSNQKPQCDETGPCKGFSDPCGNHCFKEIQRRSTMTSIHTGSFHKPTWQRMPTDFRFAPPVPENNSDDYSQSQSPNDHERSRATSDAHKTGPRSRSATHHYHHPEGDRHESGRRSSVNSHQHSVETDHHHHVPTNAFMAIGLQTSLAIALHKAPEGFITYATNHANPSLGFAVFMALFIHNISEGFAMSLPLYLALNSRLKAILWSSLLGGVSQPLGAGVAALWFKLASDSGRLGPDEGVYGGMFAITAGVMASVALSLFSESLQLTHNKNTCIAFAFLGMAILGASNALTAK